MSKKQELLNAIEKYIKGDNLHVSFTYARAAQEMFGQGVLSLSYYPELHDEIVEAVSFQLEANRDRVEELSNIALVEAIEVYMLDEILTGYLEGDYDNE